jgi:hypothetical protein
MLHGVGVCAQVVVVDEDAGSDGDSEMGDLGGDLPPAGGGGGQQQEEWQEGGAHKVVAPGGSRLVLAAGCA